MITKGNNIRGTKTLGGGIIQPDQISIDLRRGFKFRNDFIQRFHEANLPLRAPEVKP